MSASRLVPWDDVMTYFTEARERALVDMAGADDVKGIWKAQGKIDLCNELLNLRSIFDTLEEATAAKAPPAPSERDLSRERYRQTLQGPPRATSA